MPRWYSPEENPGEISNVAKRVENRQLNRWAPPQIESLADAIARTAVGASGASAQPMCHVPR